MSGSAVAREPPRLDPIFSYQMSVERRAGQLVFDIRGAQHNPLDFTAPYVSTAAMRVSPKLCVATYPLRFVFATIQGRIRELSYRVRLRRGRYDGRARRCPFARLPRRGLKSMRVRVRIDGSLVLKFAAQPFPGRATDTFSALHVPALNFYPFAVPGGRGQVRVRARYRSGTSHTIDFDADTDVVAIS